MANPFPKYPSEVIGGDEPTFAPTKSDRSLLAAERGSQLAKRLETDASNNLFVRVGASDIGASPLAVGAQTGVPDSTLTTVVTYTAAADTKLSQVAAGGSVYAKFQLFLNTTLIQTKRSGPDRAVDFCFDTPIALLAGDVLDVKVTHYVAGSLEEFEATVYGG